MATVNLAANFITGIGALGVGHLQLVRIDGADQEEIEVQAPSDFGVFGGEWVYQQRDHTDPNHTTAFIPDANGVSPNPAEYAITEIDVGNRDPDEVWQILTEIFNEFSMKGDFEYNSINPLEWQNSNSFVNTLLYMIGIDLQDVVAAATPTSVFNGFPGDTTNVILDPQQFGDSIIDFDITLTGGSDYIRTGIGDDTVNGGAGNDTIVTGRGSDVVNGGEGNDVIFGGIDDGSLLFANDNDTLDGGGGFDILAYQGSIDDYTINFDAQTINGPLFNDQDTYLNAELASFEDGIVALETVSFSEIQSGLGLGSLDDAAEAIIQAELGTEATNVNYTGSGNAAFLVSEFEIGNTISLEGGFFLTSGGFPGTSNTQEGFSVTTGQPGDSDLSAVASAAFGGAGTTRDASVLEFDLNVTDVDLDGISFDIVFGSEEFPEFSNSSFVDVAAVFVNGQNVALFNDNPSTPLSVIDANLVNGNFIDNTSGIFPTEWDGFSQVLTVRADLNIGSNSIKIGVADTGDSVLDSGLFVTNFELLGGGGTGGGILIVNDGTEGDDNLEAGLSAEEINLFGGNDVVNGNEATLNNDIITGFGEGDAIVVNGATFTFEDVTITLGSAILDIDTDQDGEPDLKITLEGDFEDLEFNFENINGGTEITVVAEPEFNQVEGTAGRDNLIGTAETDVFIFNGGIGDVGRGNGGDDIFDLSENAANGLRDNTRIVDWSDDVLVGIDLEDVHMETVRSSNTALRFAYGDDNDVLTITGNVSGGIESIFENYELA